MIKYTNNLCNMIFIVAVELRKENQIKKTKDDSNISNKNYMYFGINGKGNRNRHLAYSHHSLDHE